MERAISFVKDGELCDSSDPPYQEDSQSLSNTTSAPVRRHKTSPGRPPKVEAEARRAHLLDAAAAEFIAEGLGNANVARIARAAGVSNKTIYARYANKEELLLAVIAEMATRSFTLLETDMAATDGDPEHVLLAFGRRAAKTWTSPLEAGIYRLIVAEAPRIPRMVEIYDGAMQYFRGTLVNYLREQTQRGVFAIDDPDAAARQFGMLVYAQARERVLLGDVPSPEYIDAMVKLGVRLFMAGCATAR